MAEVGSNAPEFKLRAHDGSEISLSQYRGSKWVVISAYPFAFTGG
ncbi:MAG: redoxin domain-containing protein [Burkholderiales bacterium]|nr:redoxin domain-containing protein [Burkholderiales bacterium]